MIKKLRFVARATLLAVTNIKLTADDIKLAEDRAEQVYYADGRDTLHDGGIRQ